MLEVWDSNPGSLGAYLNERRATIGAEVGYLYQVGWDAGNETYAKLLTEDEWNGCTGNPDMDFETKGDLVEWVVSFANIVPFCPGLYQDRGMKRIYFQHGEVAIILRRTGSLTDEEEETGTARPLRTLRDAENSGGGQHRDGPATSSDNLWAGMTTRRDAATTGNRRDGAGANPPGGSTAEAGRGVRRPQRQPILTPPFRRSEEDVCFAGRPNT